MKGDRLRKACARLDWGGRGGNGGSEIGTAAVVVEQGRRAGHLARHQQIERAVVVIITPQRLTGKGIGLPQVDLLEGRSASAALVAIEITIGGIGKRAAVVEQIEIAIVVNVTPTHAPRLATNQGRRRVKEPAIIAVEIAPPLRTATVELAIHGQIKVTITVIITPGDPAEGKAGQPGTNIGKVPLCGGGTEAIIAIDRGHIDAGVDQLAANQRQIEVAIVVIVSPGRIAVKATGEGSYDQGKSMATIRRPVIAVEQSPRYAVRHAGEQQVKIAIIVIVTPGRRAYTQCRETKRQVSEAPRGRGGTIWSVIAIERGPPVAIDLPAKEQIGVAVAVIITPGQVTVTQRGQTDGGLCHQVAPLVGIEVAVRLIVGVATSQQQIQIAINVIIDPRRRVTDG